MGAVSARDFATILASARVFATRSEGHAFQILVALFHAERSEGHAFQILVAIVPGFFLERDLWFFKVQLIQTTCNGVLLWTKKKGRHYPII
jgi:hypothetical protein